MANKKVSQLTSKPSVLVTDLFPIADPTTGQLFKTTISALGTAIGSGVSSVNTLVGAVVLDTDDIQELASPTNKYFTDTRARAALSASSPLVYNSGTGAFSIPAATTSVNGYLTSTDWTTFNAKQAALSGTGFVKISGTTISYDNSTYLTTASAASTYLALAGGTMTGAIVGTTATFANSGSGIALGVTQSGASGDGIRITHSLSRAFTIQSSGSGFGILINNDTASTSAPFTIQKQGSAVVAFTDAGAGSFASSLTATSFIKSSGTSSQFLKADGSVDSSTYALDSVVVKLAGTQTITGDKAFTLAPTFDAGAGFKNPSGLYNYITATDTGWKMPVNFNKEHIFVLNTSTAYTYTFPSATGTLALTSDLGAYLPLAGGTLTGALNGTSALFSSAVRANNPSEGATGEGLIAGQSFKIDGTGTSQRAVMYMVSNVLSDTYASGLTAQFANFAGDKGFGFNLNTSGGYELYVKNTTYNKALTIANTGAATFSSSVTATSGIFSAVTSINIGAVGGDVFTVDKSTGGNIAFYANGVYSGQIDATTSGTLNIASRGTYPAITILTGGNVGINTTAPSSKLEIASASFQDHLILNRTGIGLMHITATNPRGLAITDGTTQFLTIVQSSGNVGIGTTSPATLLHVSAANAANQFRLESTTGTNPAYLGFKNSGGNYYIGADNSAGSNMFVTGGAAYAFSIVAESARAIILGTDNTERMRITSGGQTLIKGGTSNSSDFALIVTNSTPTNMLAIRNDGAFYTGVAANSPYNLTTASVSNVFVESGGLIYRSIASSQRFKDNIIDWNDSGLDTILALKPKTFTYKKEYYKNSELVMLGLIAEEVAEVSPFLADYENADRTGLVENVRYANIVVPLIKAVQELEAKIKTLENK